MDGTLVTGSMQLYVFCLSPPAFADRPRSHMAFLRQRTGAVAGGGAAAAATRRTVHNAP